jgi:hypothetical protein
MTKSKCKWVIENENMVSFRFDKHHRLNIERTQEGFTFKVFDIRGKKHKPDEPIILYTKKISDLQLGYIKEKE